MDPLAEFYFRWSPYSTCFDNPIRYIDPHGLGIFDWIKGLMDDAKKSRNSKAEMNGGEIPELTITAKRSNINNNITPDYHPPRNYPKETGISITGSKSADHGNPDAKILFEIDNNFLNLLNLTINPKPDLESPDPEDSNKSNKEKMVKETSDKDIFNKKTGNSTQSKPQNQTIVQTYLKSIDSARIKNQDGDKAWRIIERFSNDSIQLKIFPDNSNDSIIVPSISNPK